MTRAPLLEINPETLETATGEAHALLTGAKAKLGFIPNMYRYMAKLPPVLAAYLSTYEAFRGQAGFTPAEQETIFLTISRLNGCTYCTAAHLMIADRRSGMPAGSLAALRKGAHPPDARLRAVATFTEAMVTSRGNPGRAAVDEFLAAGFTEQNVLGVVLAIACKTLSNYVNHLGGTPVDAMFEPYLIE